MLSNSPPVSEPQPSPTESELRQVWRQPDGSPHGAKSFTPSQLSQGTASKSPSSPRLIMHGEAALGRDFVRTPTKLKTGERNNECLPPKKREIISPAKEMDSQKAAEEERMRSLSGVVTVSVPTTYAPVMGTENPLNRLADVAINSERQLTSTPLAPSTASLEARSIGQVPVETTPVSYQTVPYSSIYSSAILPSAKASSSQIPPISTMVPGAVTALPSSAPYVGTPYLGQYCSSGYLPSAFGQYPQIESYSAMLATMGNHIQQAQGQVNKPPLVPSQLGLPRQITPATSVGTSGQSQLFMGQDVTPEVPSTNSSDVLLDRKNGMQASPAGMGEVLIPTSNIRNILALHSGSQKLSLGVQTSSGGETVMSPNSVKISVSDDDVFKKPGAVVNHGRAVPGTGSGITVNTRTLGARMDNNLSCELPSWPNISCQILPQAMGTQASAIQYLDTFSATSLPHLSSTNTVHPIPSTVPHLAIPPGATLAPIPPPAPSAIALSHGSHVLAHFMKGSVIQLAGGDLKRVEDVKTEDFLQMSNPTSPHHVTSSTVVRITMEDGSSSGLVHITFAVGHDKNLVTVESTVDHPFFVVGQGWSSCRPERTLSRYSLQCHPLTVGDTCISLMLTNDMNGLHQDQKVKQGTECTKEQTDFTASSQNNRINRLEVTSQHQVQNAPSSELSVLSESTGDEMGSGFALPHSEIPGSPGQRSNVGLQQAMSQAAQVMLPTAATMQQSTLTHQGGPQFSHVGHQRNHVAVQSSSSSRPGLQHSSPLIHVGVPVLQQANRALPQYVQVLQPGGYMAIPVQSCAESDAMASTVGEENGKFAKLNSKLQVMQMHNHPSTSNTAVSASKVPSTDDNLIDKKGSNDTQMQKVRKRRWSAPETGDREEDAASPSRQARSVALESLIKFTSQKQGS